jgi:hypothetical protein
MTAQGDAEPDPQTQSPAFDEFRHAAGATSAEDQERIDTAQKLVDRLMHVTPEELVLLHHVGIASIEIEMARRGLEATNASTAAVGQLQKSVGRLQSATEKWSRRLVGLTIAVGAFTLLLAGVTLALLGLVAAQIVIAIVQAHG